jgi:hypothetical protein
LYTARAPARRARQSVGEAVDGVQRQALVAELRRRVRREQVPAHRRHLDHGEAGLGAESVRRATVSGKFVTALALQLSAPHPIAQRGLVAL